MTEQEGPILGPVTLTCTVCVCWCVYFYLNLIHFPLSFYNYHTSQNNIKFHSLQCCTIEWKPTPFDVNLVFLFVI